MQFIFLFLYNFLFWLYFISLFNKSLHSQYTARKICNIQYEVSVLSPYSKQCRHVTNKSSMCMVAKGRIGWQKNKKEWKRKRDEEKLNGKNIANGNARRDSSFAWYYADILVLFSCVYGKLFRHIHSWLRAQRRSKIGLNERYEFFMPFPHSFWR